MERSEIKQLKTLLGKFRQSYYDKLDDKMATALITFYSGMIDIEIHLLNKELWIE